MPQAALHLTTRQTATLTPRLQYAVRLLQLSSLEYARELQDSMSDNPFLESEELAHESLATRADEWRTPSVDDSAVTLDSHGHEPPAGSLDDAHDDPWQRDPLMQSHTATRQVGGDAQLSATDLLMAEVSLRAHLRSQANLLPISARDHALVCAVVESLDDDGYLRTELSEIAELAELEPPADGCEISTALKLVQSFEPVGVGARSVAECLALQAHQLAPGLRTLSLRIINEQLDRLAQQDLTAISKALGSSVADVRSACDAIRRLDPRPGWRHGASDAQYVAPDVLVRKHRGEWTAQLNPAVVPRLRLNKSYADLFQRHREGRRHSELGNHLQDARWAVRNVEQRFSTILMVAQAIVKRQSRFFEHGSFAMKPLGLREIALELGLHESTVCRATNNKYMATPAGVFELKHFFSRAMPMAGGGACSATAIRGVMQELIAAEDPQQPLSDVDIAQRLARQGLTVARRTVTKYRQLLKVQPVERRRREGARMAVGVTAPAGNATPR